ncbi:hypothetical protein [Citrobacter pasteurii]|nr:hypothetical protein SF123566_6302 [Shigella flexneri 1235-66]CEJ63243.1 hypothetical protein [Citrobacter pasteurii]
MFALFPVLPVIVMGTSFFCHNRPFSTDHFTVGAKNTTALQ